MLRVLICDDDPSARFILKRILMREGIVDACEAASGIEAVMLLASGGFDLLILDLQMPGADGHETLKTIRASALYDLPVIVVSGEREADAVSNVIKQGVAGFILKPLDRNSTVDNLRTLIQRLEGEKRHAKTRDAGR